MLASSGCDEVEGELGVKMGLEHLSSNDWIKELVQRREGHTG